MDRVFRLPKAPVRTKESLPPPPDGMVWYQNETSLEWKLVKQEPSIVTAEPQQTTTRSLPPTPVSPHGSSRSSSSSSNKQIVVDGLPPRCAIVESNARDDDWELLSDRYSASSNGVLVPMTAGSVRSIASVEQSETYSSSKTTLSVPFKIQRTASSSTIDSADGVLGPSGKGVLGVDYVEHVVLPTDTLQGVCLSYGVRETKLKMANHFSGNSLSLAPKRLVIPLSKKALRSGYIRVQDTDAKEYKVHAFLAEFADLGMAEAKAYLELADWDLKDAVRSARDDYEWEKDLEGEKTGEIRITPRLKQGVPVGFDTAGAGIRPNKKAVVATSDIPSIATKSVKPQDLVAAASQHNNFGVELKSIEKKR